MQIDSNQDFIGEMCPKKKKMLLSVLNQKKRKKEETIIKWTKKGEREEKNLGDGQNRKYFEVEAHAIC